MISEKIKICIAGAGGNLGKEVYERALELGREVAKAKAVHLSGMSAGFAYWSAMGAKEASGTVLGISPATSADEHSEAHKLPLKSFDFVVYTGFGQSGASLILSRTADALIVGPGELSTIDEFAMVFEQKKPIGILEGPWMTDDIIKMILEKSGVAHFNVFFDKDPKKLVEKVMKKALEMQRLSL